MAAHAHRAAAVHHGKEDHLTGHEHSKQAMEHAAKAFRHSQEAHQKSEKASDQEEKKGIPAFAACAVFVECVSEQTQFVNSLNVARLGFRTAKSCAI